MKIESIVAKNAPQAIGPYSQAILADSFIFLSMQLGIDPGSQKLVSGGIEPQLERIFFNVVEILKKAVLLTGN